MADMRKHLALGHEIPCYFRLYLETGRICENI